MPDLEEPQKADQEPPAGDDDKEKVDAPKTEDKEKAAASKTDDDKQHADAHAAEGNKVEETKIDKKRAKDKEPSDEKEEELQAEEAGSSRSKRSRKSAETFAPEDFKHVDRSLDVAGGRGKKLGDLEAVRKSVNSYSSSSEDVLLAHKLLFTTRGKPPRKEMKANILEFSGYLKKKREDQDKKELEKEDKEAEAKMSAKAYKLTVPGLKKMCDFFAIDRKGQNDKEAIVDCLLDFLGAPSESKLKDYKKKAAPKPSKKPAKQKEDDEDKDYEVIEFGTMPNDKQLRQWVRAYVRCFNLEKVTIKHALEIAAGKFGVDLASKKDTLKQLLAEEM